MPSLLAWRSTESTRRKIVSCRFCRDSCAVKLKLRVCLRILFWLQRHWRAMALTTRVLRSSSGPATRETAREQTSRTEACPVPAGYRSRNSTAGPARKANNVGKALLHQGWSEEAVRKISVAELLAIAERHRSRNCVQSELENVEITQ